MCVVITNDVISVLSCLPTLSSEVLRDGTIGTLLRVACCGCRLCLSDFILFYLLHDIFEVSNVLLDVTYGFRVVICKAVLE